MPPKRKAGQNENVELIQPVKLPDGAPLLRQNLQSDFLAWVFSNFDYRFTPPQCLDSLRISMRPVQLLTPQPWNVNRSKRNDSSLSNGPHVDFCRCVSLSQLSLKLPY